MDYFEFSNTNLHTFAICTLYVCWEESKQTILVKLSICYFLESISTNEIDEHPTSIMPVLKIEGSEENNDL